MKPKIAVVEDNLDNRILVQAILEDKYEISEYKNGEELMDGLADDIPAPVLFDVSLPGMDGSEVLNWVRSEETLSSLPVIALTAHAMSGDREKYLEMGFDEYVTKPIVDEDILMEAIERLLARSA